MFDFGALWGGGCHTFSLLSSLTYLFLGYLLPSLPLFLPPSHFPDPHGNYMEGASFIPIQYRYTYSTKAYILVIRIFDRDFQKQ